MLIATTPHLPDVNYVALGPVFSRSIGVAAMEPMKGGIADLEQQAQKMGADAVIGVQVSSIVYRSLATDVRMVVLMGTAIKFAQTTPGASANDDDRIRAETASFYRAQATNKNA